MSLFLVTEPLRFAEPNAVDDAGVIQFVADHGVFCGRAGFEQAAVRIEARRVKNRVFRAEKFGQRGLEFLVDVLRAADKAHRRHAETVSIERFFRRREDGGMIGQSEVIVRAKIDHVSAVSYRDFCVLRPRNNALRFVKTLRPDFIERLGEMLFESREHGDRETTQVPRREKDESGMRTFHADDECHRQNRDCAVCE